MEISTASWALWLVEVFTFRGNDITLCKVWMSMFTNVSWLILLITSIYVMEIGKPWNILVFGVLESPGKWCCHVCMSPSLLTSMFLCDNRELLWLWTQTTVDILTSLSFTDLSLHLVCTVASGCTVDSSYSVFAVFMVLFAQGSHAPW